MVFNRPTIRLSPVLDRLLSAQATGYNNKRDRLRTPSVLAKFKDVNRVNALSPPAITLPPLAEMLLPVGTPQ